MSSSGKVHDVTIVGAGPVGLFAVFYAGMRQMSIHLIDSLAQVGGQLAALYPEKYIYDMPGFPKVLAKTLVRDLWDQAQLGKPDLSLNTKIQRIEKRSNGEQGEIFEIRSDDGRLFKSRTIILALGAGAFSPRKLDTPGLSEREGKNVHYVLKPLDYYNGKEILVIGGGDSAVDWALAFSANDEHGKCRCLKTTLIHRGSKFTAHEATVSQLQETSCDIRMTHELESLEDVVEGERTRLKATVFNNQNKETHSIVVDDIVICTGYTAKIDFVKESGLATSGNSIVVNDRMETNVPGIFAVGDICSHPGKLKLIATGVGEAAIAANFAKVHIDPSAKAFPGHSTSKLADKT